MAYPIAWLSTVALAPYLGLYGDYYFNSDNATTAVAASGLPGAVVVDGFSACGIGGVTANFANGGQVTLGAEFSGNASIWIYRARASLPFWRITIRTVRSPRCSCRCLAQASSSTALRRQATRPRYC